mmetsp:Transcript_41535/g.110767  ORF Transcript_41535/g.110767 Transcript_41535/m.110767 type:complete len:243 (-) Transcript_41535:142-870(-)
MLLPRLDIPRASAVCVFLLFGFPQPLYVHDEAVAGPELKEVHLVGNLRDRHNRRRGPAMATAPIHAPRYPWRNGLRLEVFPEVRRTPRSSKVRRVVLFTLDRQRRKQLLSEHIAKSLLAVTEMHTEPVVVFAALPIPDLGSVCVGGVIFHHEREAVAVAKHVVVGGVMLEVQAALARTMRSYLIATLIRSQVTMHQPRKQVLGDVRRVELREDGNVVAAIVIARQPNAPQPLDHARPPKSAR